MFAGQPPDDCGPLHLFVLHRVADPRECVVWVARMGLDLFLVVLPLAGLFHAERVGVTVVRIDATPVVEGCVRTLGWLRERHVRVPQSGELPFCMLTTNCLKKNLVNL
jgi:hypothetical protein